MTKLVYLTISVALIAACASPEPPKKDQIPKVPITRLDGLKIAYYANDSIKKYFEYF